MKNGGLSPQLETAAARLDRMISGGRFFHACIVSGGSEAERERFAAALAAAAVCLDETNKPCMSCSGCHKALQDAHQDIYHLRAPADRRTIPVDMVRAACAQMSIRPGEAPRRAVLIHHAEMLGAPGQNALLATLEEPASAVLFIIITENEQTLLETVRSRCAAVRLGASEAAETEKSELFAAFAALAAARSTSAVTEGRAALTAEAMKLGKIKTAELPAVLESFRGECAQALLAAEYAGEDGSAYDRAERAAMQCIDFARANVSAGHISGWAAAALIRAANKEN